MRATVSHIWFCCLKADNWEFMVSKMRFHKIKQPPQGCTNTLTSVHFVFIHCKHSRELLHTNSLLGSPPNPTGSQPFWILWYFFFLFAPLILLQTRPTGCDALHKTGSCGNISVCCPICSKLNRFDKGLALNTSVWQYSLVATVPSSGYRKSCFKRKKNKKQNLNKLVQINQCFPQPLRFTWNSVWMTLRSSGLNVIKGLGKTFTAPMAWQWILMFRHRGSSYCNFSVLQTWHGGHQTPTNRATDRVTNPHWTSFLTSCLQLDLRMTYCGLYATVISFQWISSMRFIFSANTTHACFYFINFTDV